MAKKKKGFDTKSLNKLLEQIGAELHSNTDGTGVTNDEALIRTLWKKALGYTEVVADKEGEEREVRHKPERWAVELIYLRREGAVPTVQGEDRHRMTAAEEVSTLAKDRLNRKVKGGERVRNETNA
jgi:hypothetical protein